MVEKKHSSIITVEQEFEYMNKIWGRMETYEKVVVITYTFLFFYLLIVIYASYDGLTKSSNPSAGKAVFWLAIATGIIVFIPIIAHYSGLSTYGVIHIIGLVGVVTFVATLWIIFETFDKRVIQVDQYKDPYSMAMYFLLISFSVMFVVGSISRKM